MRKRAASRRSGNNSPTLALNDFPSISAQEQLLALRHALESRLAVLEEVLADGTRGDSLAGLILDLSRVATEEAQAAASHACMATKADADKEIAALRASAKAALQTAQAALRSTQASLDQERAIAVDLRRAVDLAQLENDKQAELLTAREQLEASMQVDRERLEAEVARQRSIIADLQHGVGDLERAAVDLEQQLESERRSSAERQSQLEAERASGAELRRFVESATARLTTVERELVDERAAHDAAVADLADARAAYKAVVVDLASERETSADHERIQARLQSLLEAERATVAGLQQGLVRAEELNAALGRETSMGRESHEESAFLQKSLTEARNALAAVHVDLEAERATIAEVREAAEFTDRQLASARSSEAQALADHQKLSAQLDAMIKERDALAGELAVAKQVSQRPEAEAGAATQPAAPHLKTHPAHAAVKTPALASPPERAEFEGDWKPVRLASRYVFGTELSVQVNGNPARLCDLSTSGCQLLSPTALRPNQMVKVVLPDTPPVKCSGKVAWTRLEPMAVGQPLGYRAGVRFTKMDQGAIESFTARHALPLNG